MAVTFAVLVAFQDIVVQHSATGVASNVSRQAHNEIIKEEK